MCLLIFQILMIHIKYLKLKIFSFHKQTSVFPMNINFELRINLTRNLSIRHKYRLLRKIK